ncbi:hypothetical protein [Rhodopirellula europaea]|nr:hypothetical protein [Rhodopirellula europaea]
MPDDPVAFFLTWPTYGTWLPGDRRGWVLHQHGWKMPDPSRQIEAAARMNEDACLLSVAERDLVERQVAETCRVRRWELHASSCQSNHLHVVLSAPGVDPKRVRADLKAWCTRRLNEGSRRERKRWWADRGSQRYVWDEEALERVVIYVQVAQGRKDRDLDGR